MSNYIQILTTVDSKEAASVMAQQLVNEGLAACVQVAGPVQSTYRWQGVVETAEEWQCLVKTDRAHYTAIEKRIGEMHPYDVPEIIAFPIQHGSRDYLGWLGDQLT
jgi:periplasmic divalent cation tolerance protein